jgi:hypothetical protein
LIGQFIRTPSWAVGGCRPWQTNGEWCQPAGAVNRGYFADFAEFAAQRYDGHHGVGFLQDFLVGNEVDNGQWYDMGSRGISGYCQSNWIGSWLDSYTALFNGAYDRITARRPDAHVMVTITGDANPSNCGQHQVPPRINIFDFLTGVGARANGRQWHVALHPYSVDMGSPTFGTDDYAHGGMITFGTLGRLTGWLNAHYPHVVTTITEVGFTAVGPTGRDQSAAQDRAVCDSYREALATPGIDGYLLHRLLDHPDEVGPPLLHYFGLFSRGPDGGLGPMRPAWATWALMNRYDVPNNTPRCGFEQLPYVRLVPRVSTSGRLTHWATTRMAAPGFVDQGLGWRLLRDPQPGTGQLFECSAGSNDHFVSPSANCEGQTPMGSLGYIYLANPPNVPTIRLYRCLTSANFSDHFISQDAQCEGQRTEAPLGYALFGGPRP